MIYESRFTRLKSSHMIQLPICLFSKLTIWNKNHFCLWSINFEKYRLLNFKLVISTFKQGNFDREYTNNTDWSSHTTSRIAHKYSIIVLTKKHYPFLFILTRPQNAPTHTHRPGIKRMVSHMVPYEFLVPSVTTKFWYCLDSHLKTNPEKKRTITLRLTWTTTYFLSEQILTHNSFLFPFYFISTGLFRFLFFAPSSPGCEPT